MALTRNVSGTGSSLGETTSPKNCAPDGLAVSTSDSNSIRLSWVWKLIEQCGGRPVLLLDSRGQAGKSFPDSSIAVISMRSGPGDSEFKATLDELKSCNCKVLCYEDGTASLPLSIRCQMLLAGCVRILDSSHSDFEKELQSWLKQAIQAEAASRRELEQCRTLMQELGIVGESEAMTSAFRL